MSGSFEGVDPSLEGSRGKGDDYPWLFTLNYAEILGFEPAHDANHGHIGETRPRGSQALQALGAPKVVPELDRLDLVEAGCWGWPKGSQPLEGAHRQAEPIPIYYQNRHEIRVLPASGVV